FVRFVPARNPNHESRVTTFGAARPVQLTEVYLGSHPEKKAVPLDLLAAGHFCLDHMQAVSHYAFRGKPYESHCIVVSQRDLEESTSVRLWDGDFPQPDSHG